MLIVRYDGVVLGTYEFNAAERLYTLTLNKFATVKVLRRFISRELMNGTTYVNSVARELAVAIITAFATPTLQFVQQSYAEPQWVAYMRQRWTAGKFLGGELGTPWSKT